MRRLGILLMFFLLVLFIVIPASAGIQKQWADLATSVDANGNIITTRVYGYYADVEGFGQVFVVCDPDTGQETGDAFVPGGKIGEKQSQKIVRYDRRQDLDWDHPKQISPVRLSLIAPNIPTETRYDWDYYDQTGQLVKKAENMFAWPMDWSFARMIPGSDPNYWLIVGVLENPNPYPVKAELGVNIFGWNSGWSSKWIDKKAQEVLLGPNETKYMLLNYGQEEDYLAKELWCKWPRPGCSVAYYYVRIDGVGDPEYPDVLKSGGAYGFFVPYVRWDGTNPVVKPLIPMRLAFSFNCYSNDPYKRDYYYYYYGGREWPPCSGRAEYDPVKGDWNVSVYFWELEERNWAGQYENKPSYMSDEQWEQIINRARQNAVTTLKKLFLTWYPRVPFWCSWWDDYSMYVNGDTGQVYNSGGGSPPADFWRNIWYRNFIVSFGYLEPVPPNDAPPAYPPSWWWANIRWGGWLYTTYGPYASGAELPAPVLSSFPRTGTDEFNYDVYYCNYRDGDRYEIVIPKGTGIYYRSTDVRYYDPNGWMRYLPVTEAIPMFIEQYRFVSTQGDFGYLIKETVPGYLLWVDTERRPVLNTVTQPVEVNVTWRCWGNQTTSNFSRLVDVYRYWRWTPQSGWQFLGQSPSDGTVTLLNSYYTSVWTVSFKYNHTVSGSNSNDFQVSWTYRWGNGAPTLYWPGADMLRAKIASMANRDYEGNPLVNYVNIDPTISLPMVPSLEANEQNKWIAFCEKSSSAEFVRGRSAGESWGSFETRTLAEIVNNIVSPVLSSQEEAVFNGGGRFVMTPTFAAGKGGIIGGAQKYLIHYQKVWDSKWEWYVWDDPTYDAIGFPGADMTRCSYISTSSPTGGFVVKADDEYLGEILRRRYTEIPFGDYVPLTQRLWRFYSGTIYPPPYPEG